LAWAEAELPQGMRIRTRGMWTGALVPRQVWAVVGPVNGELFIRGEDEEYPWRIAQAGFAFEGVRDAVLDHPGPADLVNWSFAGKHLFFERGLADWKFYYKVRNMVWLKRRQAGAGAALKIALAYVMVATFCDGPRRLPLLWRAIGDGWHGRLGRVEAEKLKC